MPPTTKKAGVSQIEKIYGAGQGNKRNQCNPHASTQGKSPSRKQKSRSPYKVHMKKYSMMSQVQSVRNQNQSSYK